MGATIQQSPFDVARRATPVATRRRARIGNSSHRLPISAMTYCVALRLDQGLVFLADSRTNAGVDHVSTYRKMTVYERPGERVLVLMTSGNLAAGQAVRQLVSETQDTDGISIWNASSLFDVARIVGDAVRKVRARDAAALEDAGIDFAMSIIVGGQIKGEPCRLFLVYSAGNFIEALAESPYFQIGESKYGKPVLDRMITPKSSLEEGAKCALVSMDSTMRSNLSVGLPLDLLVYEVDRLAVTRFAMIDANNEYFRMIHDTWGERLKQIFLEIPSPIWDASGALEDASTEPTRMAGSQYSTQSEAKQPRAEPVRAKPPGNLDGETIVHGEVQTLAEERGDLPQAD
jgi:putative proteasome-type protease